MAEDLEADMLLLEAQLLEEDGVVLGLEHREHGVGWWPAAKGVDEGCLRGHHAGEHVGRMVGVGRDLDGQLTGRGQGGRPLPEHGWVIGNPLEGGVGEDNVIVRGVVVAPGELVDVSQLEMQPFTGQRTGLVEHGGGVVDAERVGRLHAHVQLLGEGPGPTAEVDDASPVHAAEQGNQVVEGPAALGREALVLVGPPRRGIASHDICLSQRT